ncbi:MAG: hypothetical protein ACREJC_21040, partial [Tepidisphaeraceae bacterium]
MMLAPIAYNEAGLLLFGTLCVGWVAHALRAAQGRAGCWIVAGILAGLGCGTKFTAVPMLVVAVPLAGALSCPKDWRGTIPRAFTFVVAAMVTLAPWLIRNVVWARNPVFPQATGLFGKANFTDVQVERWARAHAPRDDQRSAAARLAALWKQAPADWRFGFSVLPLGLIAALCSWRLRDSRFLILLLLLMTGFWLCFTHLQGRFLVLAIPLAALLIGQIQSLRWLIPAVLGVVAGSSAGWLILVGRIDAVRPVLGLDDMNFLLREIVLPRDVADRMLESTQRVSLVGDARAFWYSIPTSRLRYRTVFD